MVWTCEACTFVNEGTAAGFLCCSMCGIERKEKKERKAAWSFLGPPPSTRRVSLVLERRRQGSFEARWFDAKTHDVRPGLRRVWTATRRLLVRTEPNGAKHEHIVALALDCDDATAPWTPPTAGYSGNKDKGGLSMLQSHMQKCVRRGLVDQAKRTALELAAIRFGPKVVGLDMLLRRLPIILVEDTVPPRGLLAPLIFYMLAVKQADPAADCYRMTGADVAFVIGVVGAAAACSHPPVSFPDKYLKRASPPATLSLLARAAYGGMPGDVHMCLRAASFFSDESTLPIPDAFNPEPVSTLRRLRPQDWVPAGVDFHCIQGDILRRIRASASNPDLQAASDDELKTWMWTRRSSINFRNKDPSREEGSAKRRRLLEDDRPQHEEPTWGAEAHVLADAAARDMIIAAYRP